MNVMRSGLDCISCALPMCGVHSYTIRDTCSPCGGDSKIEPMKGKTVKHRREPMMKLKEQAKR